mgnify:CR=1 FL=1
MADPHQERAAAYARQFGAPRHYHDHREMLAHERLDAIFAVTDYDEYLAGILQMSGLTTPITMTVSR